MRELLTGRKLWFIGLMLAFFAAATGCQSAPSLPKWLGRESTKSNSTPWAGAPKTGEKGTPKTTFVQPGMELTWALKTSTKQPGLVQAGKSRVGPDGALVIGPYGSCPVAGLTLEEAGTRIEKQLSAFVKQPRVIVSAVAPSVNEGEIAWRKSVNPSGPTLAQSLSSRKDDPIRTTGGIQTPPKDGSGALPLLTLNPKDELPTPRVLSAQPTSGKHSTKQPVGLPLPVNHAPNEMSPVLLPEYIIRPPDVLLIETERGLRLKDLNRDVPLQPIRGQHLVRPDGTVGLGMYGSVLVAGKTITQAREEIAKAIFARLDQKNMEAKRRVFDELSVDVLAYNSSVFYVITDGAGLGEQVYRFPVTGSETVLDAISHINGLPVVASPRRIWVARRNPGMGGGDSIYPVDWRGISRQGSMATNWQIMPGDRVYVQADPVRRFNNNLSKYLEPVERVFGGMLLGSQAVNSIRSGTTITTR